MLHYKQKLWALRGFKGRRLSHKSMLQEREREKVKIFSNLQSPNPGGLLVVKKFPIVTILHVAISTDEKFWEGHEIMKWLSGESLKEGPQLACVSSS